MKNVFLQIAKLYVSTISTFALYKFGKIILQYFLTEARGLKGDQPPDHVLFMTRATSKLYSDCYMGCRVSVMCCLQNENEG